MRTSDNRRQIKVEAYMHSGRLLLIQVYTKISLKDKGATNFFIRIRRRNANSAYKS